jgi:4-hydroxy-2-oxoheptanedioate aldolase
MTTLKAALAEPRPMIMVNPGGVALPAVDMLARHGARVLFIDCERTPVGVTEAATMARAARAAGMFSLIRTETREPAALIRYLDCGADGLILPQVEDAATCAMLVRAASDHALGAPRAALVVQIETVAGVSAVDAIGAAPGVDAVLLGPNDLALSMGLPGQPNHPDVEGACIRVAERLTALGRPFGMQVTEATAAAWIGRGTRLVSISLDRIVGAGLGPVRKLLP